jgi:hypothetical protein
VKDVGNMAIIRVKYAGGLTDAIENKRQGAPQGGRFSPQLWTLYDDPLCTALHEEAENCEADPVVVAVPFAGVVAVTGKSFADDKRFVASTAAGLQRRFDMSNTWNGLNEVRANVSKSRAQAMVHAIGGKYVPIGSLPAITMVDKDTGLDVAIEMLEPWEPMKSLGMQTSVALCDGNAVAEARAAANRVGVCVAKGSAPKQLSVRLLDQCAERSALYKIRTSSVGPEDIQDIQARSFMALKNRVNLCKTTPNDVVSSLVSLDWGSKHYSEQLMMVMKLLSKKGTTVEKLLLSAMQHHLLWNGGVGGLGSRDSPRTAWDGTLLCRLHFWMKTMNLELRGPVETPLGRVNDSLIMSLAASQHEREVLAIGIWPTDAWRVSDCVCWDSTLISALSEGGEWETQIDNQQQRADEAVKITGSEWGTLVRRLVGARIRDTPLGRPLRGSIRHGAMVTFPHQQLSATHGGNVGQPVIGIVVEDRQVSGGWDDLISVQLLRYLDIDSDEFSRLKMRTSPPLRLQQGGDVDAGAALRSRHENAGFIYAEVTDQNKTVYCANELLEVKLARIELRKPCPTADGREIETIWQLEESMDSQDMIQEKYTPLPTLTREDESFEFMDRDRVIGHEAAEAMGYMSGGEQWEKLIDLREEAITLGGDITLVVVSDGSVTGEGFSAHSTYGWVCCGMKLSGLTWKQLHGSDAPEHEHDCEGIYELPTLLAGAGEVFGPPEWTSSTRAEATGLLAAVMGVLTSGWIGPLELRLDNDSSVQRAGGLVLADSRAATLDGMDASTDITNGLAIENAEIWTEFAAWRRVFEEEHSKLEVIWHPGHPEKRKRMDKADWTNADHAIFLADELAEGMHKQPRSGNSRKPTEWSHVSAWRLYWRDTLQTGCIAKRLRDAVRADLLHRYIATAALGPGAEGDWLLPELLARTIGRNEGDITAKVHRAKSVAGILGTRYTQHRRLQLDETQDPICRLCGEELETGDHIIWECKNPLLRKVRRKLSLDVRTIWRVAGLGQKELSEAHLLWRLDSDDAVICKGVSDISELLEPNGERCAISDLIKQALLGHTLDTSGMALERAGFFGGGWIPLLEELGLSRDGALTTLATLTGLLHGPDGTQAVWSAFTAGLENANPTKATDMQTQPVSCDMEFEEWRASVRSQLRAKGCEDNQVFRMVTIMSSSGYSQADRDEFTWAVTIWDEGIELGEESEYTRLQDAIRGAFGEVVACRRARSEPLISIREAIRAEIKAKAFDRMREKASDTRLTMPTALVNRGPPPPRKVQPKVLRPKVTKARTNASTSHCIVHCLPASDTAERKRTTKRTQGKRKTKAARIEETLPTTRAQRAAKREEAKTKATPAPTAKGSAQMEVVPVPDNTEEESPLWDDQMHWSDVEDFGVPMPDDHWDVQMQAYDMETGDAQGTEDLWDNEEDVRVVNARQVETQGETPCEGVNRKRHYDVGDPVTSKSHKRKHRGDITGLCLETQFKNTGTIHSVGLGDLIVPNDPLCQDRNTDCCSAHELDSRAEKQESGAEYLGQVAPHNGMQQETKDKAECTDGGSAGRRSPRGGGSTGGVQDACRRDTGCRDAARILLLAGGREAGIRGGDCGPAGAGGAPDLYQGREGGIQGAAGAYLREEPRDRWADGGPDTVDVVSADEADAHRTAGTGQQRAGTRSGVRSACIRADAADAGPSAKERSVQGALRSAVGPVVGLLGQQERICLSADAAKRGAARGLEKSSGRRESRWQGEGKRLEQGRASGKGRERELDMQGTRKRRNKGSSEAAVGTSEQEPD